MISPLTLERPGWWRGAGLTLGFLLAAIPIITVVIAMLTDENQSGTPIWDGAWLTAYFLSALGHSVTVGLAVCATSVLLGLPTGVFAALYAVPFRKTLLGLVALPLLVPSFLWAIGFSMLRISLGMSPDGILSGFSGTVMVFSASATPLVVLATWASVMRISQSESEAARMAGGEQRLLFNVARSVFPMALAAGMLGGIVTLSDPGPGQILGYDGAASHILVSFAAQYNFTLATQQSLAMALLVLILAIPLSVWLVPRMVSALLARQTNPLREDHRTAGKWIGLFFLLTMVAAGIFLPLYGLTQPLLEADPDSLHRAFHHAGKVVNRTLIDTLFLACLAGVIGMIMGMTMALCAGREKKWRAILLAGSLVFFSIPSTLTSMGVMFLAVWAPDSFDFLLRSDATAGVVGALRFFPLAAVLGVRAFGAASPEWTLAAAIHGMPLRTYFLKIILPWILPTAGVVTLLIALLATADITAAHLLSPPGGGTLPLALFKVMANAPEALVGALSLIYIGGAALALTSGFMICQLLKKHLTD